MTQAQKNAAYYAGKNAAWAMIECDEDLSVSNPYSEAELAANWKQGFRDACREENLNRDEAWG